MRMENYMKRIEIGVGSLKGGLREFARVWRRAAAGDRLPEATPKVHFGSLAQLLSMLTPKRLELLDTVARKPECSIFAAELARSPSSSNSWVPRSPASSKPHS